MGLGNEDDRKEERGLVGGRGFRFRRRKGNKTLTEVPVFGRKEDTTRKKRKQEKKKINKNKKTTTETQNKETKREKEKRN